MKGGLAAALCALEAIRACGARPRGDLLVESVIGEIAAALERGEMVKISSFGSFAVRQKGERVGRNPKTGEEVPISPRRVLVFRASHALKHQINNGLADAVPEAGAAAKSAVAPRAGKAASA